MSSIVAHVVIGAPMLLRYSQEVVLMDYYWPRLFLYMAILWVTFGGGLFLLISNYLDQIGEHGLFFAIGHTVLVVVIGFAMLIVLRLTPMFYELTMGKGPFFRKWNARVSDKIDW